MNRKQNKQIIKIIDAESVSWDIEMKGISEWRGYLYIDLNEDVVCNYCGSTTYHINKEQFDQTSEACCNECAEIDPWGV